MLQILNHLGAEVERASGVVTVKAEKGEHRCAIRCSQKNACLSLCIGSTFREREGGDCPLYLAGASSEIVRSICTCGGFESLGAAVRVHAGDIKVFRASASRCEYFAQGQVLARLCLVPTNVMMAAVFGRRSDGYSRTPLPSQK